MTRTPSFLALSILFALSGACGDDDTSPTDAGGSGTDAGNGGTDAGNGGTDAGNGGTDAGNGGTDGAVADGGDTDGGDTDGGAGTCPDLAPTQGDDALIISQIDLENDMVEFYNPTDSAIDLEGYTICQRPQYQTFGAGAGTVPAGGYLTVATGSVSFAATGAGELNLYDQDSISTPMDYGDRENMVDFVCWDGDRGASRKSVAEMMEGGVALWSGACAAAPSNDAVRRIASNAGSAAADYDVASAIEARSCP